MRASRHQGIKKAPQDFSRRAFMYDIQLCAWSRFPVHLCYHYIRKRKGGRPRFYSSDLVGSAISVSASSGTPVPFVFLHYNYTHRRTGFLLKSFHGSSDCVLTSRGVRQFHLHARPPSPVPIAFLYTIIMMLGSNGARKPRCSPQPPILGRF